MTVISRRDALLGATAAVAVAGVPTAVAARAALAGDPVLPAFEAFEVKRRDFLAVDKRVDAVCAAVEAEMPPRPSAGRCFKELSYAEVCEEHAWAAAHDKRVTAIVGGDQDQITESYRVPMRAAYVDLMGIEATTLAGLLCQIRAWAFMYESPRDSEVSKIDPKDWGDLDPELVLPRVYHDLERLAGEAPS